LLQAVWIAKNRASGTIENLSESNLLFVGCQLHGCYGCLNYGWKLGRSRIKLQFAGDNAGNIQDVFDDARLQPGVTFDHFKRASDVSLTPIRIR